MFEVLGDFISIVLTGVTLSSDSQTFWPQDLFKLLKIIEGPHELLFLRVVSIDIYHMRN